MGGALVLTVDRFESYTVRQVRHIRSTVSNEGKNKMRIYMEMECDCGCEDGKFCMYFNKDTKSCDFHKMRNIKNCENKDR